MIAYIAAHEPETVQNAAKLFAVMLASGDENNGAGNELCMSR